VLFSACSKEVEDFNPPLPNLGDKVPVRLSVQVINANGEPISGVTLTALNTVMTSSNEGLAEFPVLNFSKYHAFVKAESPNYLSAFSFFTPEANKGVSVTIHLQPKNQAVTFSSSNGGEVALPSGGKITFSPNSFLNSNGNEYSGQVRVSANFIAPDQTSPIETSVAINSGGDLRFADNRGAISVDLLAANGEKLKLKSDRPAQVSIPADPQATGSELRGLHFNESTGLWEDRLSVSRQGNFLTFEATHFSFWMCAYLYSHAFKTGTLTCGSSELSNTPIKIYNQWGYCLGSTTTNAIGGFSGSFPLNTPLSIGVFDLCNTQVSTQSIGPFSGAGPIPPIDGCSASANFATLSAQVQDCNQQGDPNAMLVISTGGFQKILPNNGTGSFSRTILFCSNATNANVKAVNLQSNSSSPTVTVPISQSMNVGTLSLCEALPDQFVQFTMDGEDFYYTPDNVTIFSAGFGTTTSNSHLFYLNVMTTVPANQTRFYVRLVSPTNGPGNYTIPGNSFSFNVKMGNDQSGATVNISAMNSAPGGIVEGSVSNFTYSTFQNSSTHTIANCNFRFIVQ
jgi:hypothetical protein